MSDTTLIGTRRAAEVAGVDRSTLTRWVQAEKITPAITVPGYKGALLFHLAEVQALAKGEK